MDIGSDAFVRTNNTIDLTYIKTLVLYIDGLWTNDAWTMEKFYIGFLASSDAITAANQSAGSGKSIEYTVSGQGLSNQSRTITIDVSDLKGSYYIGAGSYTYLAQSFGGFKIRQIKGTYE